MGNILKPKDLESIKIRIADLRRDDRALWGKMNLGEMLCHTADQIKMCTGEIKVEEQSSFKTRVILKRLLLAGMKAPRGKIETFPQINPQKGGSKPVNFESDRDYLVKKILEFIHSEEGKLCPHPAFGKLSKKQWGKIIYAHLDHHLNQFGS